MKIGRATLAAGLSGIFISLLGLGDSITPFDEILAFFALFGAGIVYGLATAHYLFISKIKRLAWVLTSMTSYVTGVFVALHGPGSEVYIQSLDSLNDSFKDSLIYGGAAGALVLAAGYKLLKRSAAISWLLIAVLLGSGVAHLVDLLAEFTPLSFLLLWPIWQVIVTWSLLKSGEH